MVQKRPLGPPVADPLSIASRIWSLEKVSFCIGPETRVKPSFTRPMTFSHSASLRRSSDVSSSPMISSFGNSGSRCSEMSACADRSATVTGDLSFLMTVSCVTRVSWTCFVLRVSSREHWEDSQATPAEDREDGDLGLSLVLGERERGGHDGGVVCPGERAMERREACGGRSEEQSDHASAAGRMMLVGCQNSGLLSTPSRPTLAHRSTANSQIEAGPPHFRHR